MPLKPNRRRRPPTEPILPPVPLPDSDPPQDPQTNPLPPVLPPFPQIPPTVPRPPKDILEDEQEQTKELVCGHEPSSSGTQSTIARQDQEGNCKL